MIVEDDPGCKIETILRGQGDNSLLQVGFVSGWGERVGAVKDCTGYEIVGIIGVDMGGAVGIWG